MKDSFLVAAGILLSRIMGLVRQRVFSHYFGLSDEADAFMAALRIPNFLQNLFGEGVLSASFIPVYASLLARDDEEEAGRVAGAIGAILAAGHVGPGAARRAADALSDRRHRARIHGGQSASSPSAWCAILFPGVGLLVIVGLVPGRFSTATAASSSPIRRR